MVVEQKNGFLFMVYLVGLSIIGFLATDMYLPAFDVMRVDLDTTKSAIASSLSLFLGGYAIAQLMWGPISDKLGRPKTILLGLSIFVVASLGIYFTHNVTLLLVLRLVQAIGVCAAAVSWQALVIERYPASDTNKVLATIMPLVALSPALAPLIGVALLDYFSWRAIFITLALLALLLIAYTFTLKDSSPCKADDAESAADAPAASKSYLSLLKSNRYLGNVLIYAVCSGAFFAWLTGSPFFLKELGYNESQIGFSFVPQTIAFMAGGYGYRYVSNRIEGQRLMPFILVAYSLSLVGVYLITVLTTPTLTLLLIPFLCHVFVQRRDVSYCSSASVENLPEELRKGCCLAEYDTVGNLLCGKLRSISVFSGCTVDHRHRDARDHTFRIPRL